MRSRPGAGSLPTEGVFEAARAPLWSAARLSDINISAAMYEPRPRRGPARFAAHATGTIPDNESMLSERPVSIILAVIISLAPAFVCGVALAQEPAASDWGYWGGDSFGQRYSPLRQIDRNNVAKLRIAWTYRTGELGRGLAHADRLGFEATPILAFGSLYVSTPTNTVIALDPATGRERWRFDPGLDRKRDYPALTSRGVAAWSDPDEKHPGVCGRRIFAGTLDGRLLALDAESGRACQEFGAHGEVSIATSTLAVLTPPVVYRNLVLVAATSGQHTGRGVVRAFDARSGAARWSFAPTADERSSAAVAVGTATPLGALSLDPGRGIVFVATGGAEAGAPDNRLADALVALDAGSGKLLWDRQLVHHDLWNSGLEAQPSLIDLDLGADSSSAVIEATRQGMLFVFDRESGVPVFPLTERRVPESHVPGVTAAPTQLFSTLPALVSLEPVALEDAWGLSFWDRNDCRDRIAALRNEGVFTPPDPEGTLVDPGALGGVDWGGIAFDPLRQRVIAAVNEVPYVLTLVGHEVRREPLLSRFGLPCTAPPWGTLVDVDLKTRRVVWQVPLGSTEGFAPWWLPVREFGLPHLGGPIITGGNLVFVGAAADAYLRAFDVETGRELWKHRLPAGGQATPMTYLAGPVARQFVVIAAGGNGELGTPRGDWLVAFALAQP